MLTMYGEQWIDHIDNLVWTCPGKCNSSVLITFNPVARGKLMAEIAVKIEEENDN